MPNVTVLICTFNSRLKLPRTLEHLKRQRVPSALSWEVIIVDHVPGDGTICCAMSCWSDFPVPLRCYEEPRPGKTPALERGLTEAMSDIVCIVDDDNWLDQNYISTAYSVMTQNPRVGVVGAYGIAACETKPPDWFESLKYMYAVGHQSQVSGDVTGIRTSFWGAGCVVRRSAWDLARRKGFVPIFNPSRADGLSFSAGSTGGEDPELCLAIQMVGYRLWYEPTLIYTHFIPTGRLNLGYIDGTARAVTLASPILKVYEANLPAPAQASAIRRLIYNHWSLHFIAAVAVLIKASLGALITGSSVRRRRGLIAYRAQVEGLLRYRRNYSTMVRNIMSLSK